MARSEYIDNILLALNSFHKNIKFTFEIEKDNTIPFLDILITKKHERFKLQCIGKRHVPICISIGILLRLNVGNGEL